MRLRLVVLAAAGLALGGCYGPYYGPPNVAGAALVGAGVGAVAGAAIASGPAYYAPPPAYYGYGYAPRYYGYGYAPYGYRHW